MPAEFATVSGKVTDYAGKHMKAKKDGWPAHVTFYKQNGKAWEYATSTHVSNNGTYKVDRLVPGSYTVLFRGPQNGSDPADPHSAEWWPNKRSHDAAKILTLEKGQIRTGIDAKLEYVPTLKLGKLSGNVKAPVTLKANKKAATGKVVVYKGKKKIATVKLNKKGKATLKLPKQKRGSRIEYRVKYLGSKKAAPGEWLVTTSRY